MPHHYVFTSFNRQTGQFYIAARTAIDPYTDPYMGSGIWVRRQEGLEKEVLRVFDTRVEAERLETQLINALGDNPNCRNTLHLATKNLDGLAFKVSPAFRKRFRMRALASGLKLNELLVEALAAWERAKWPCAAAAVAGGDDQAGDARDEASKQDRMIVATAHTGAAACGRYAWDWGCSVREDS